MRSCLHGKHHDFMTRKTRTSSAIARIVSVFRITKAALAAK